MWEVIDAIGSLGSMILAGVAGFVAYRLFKIESERDVRAAEYQRQRDEEATRAQAAAIGFWWQEDSLRVANHSNLPIQGLELWCLADRPIELVDSSGRSARTLRPGEEAVAAKFVDQPRGKPAIYRPAKIDLSLLDLEWVAHFADNAGRGWYRHLAGELGRAEAVDGRMQDFWPHRPDADKEYRPLNLEFLEA